MAVVPVVFTLSDRVHFLAWVLPSAVSTGLSLAKSSVELNVVMAHLLASHDDVVSELRLRVFADDLVHVAPEAPVNLGL